MKESKYITLRKKILERAGCTSFDDALLYGDHGYNFAGARLIYSVDMMLAECSRHDPSFPKTAIRMEDGRMAFFMDGQKVFAVPQLRRSGRQWVLEVLWSALSYCRGMEDVRKMLCFAVDAINDAYIRCKGVRR